MDEVLAGAARTLTGENVTVVGGEGVAARVERLLARVDRGRGVSGGFGGGGLAVGR